MGAVVLEFTALALELGQLARDFTALVLEFGCLVRDFARGARVWTSLMGLKSAEADFFVLYLIWVFGS